jgi:Copper binding proteins, plastocyanin/azurin family
MLRLALIGLAGAAAIATTTALAAPDSSGGPLLIGITGPEAPTISVKLRGRRVTRLKPGTYRLRVYDRSDSHDFHLRGPRTDRRITNRLFTGARLVNVTLRKGRYEYYCAPHYFGGMNGTFVVR